MKWYNFSFLTNELGNVDKNFPIIYRRGCQEWTNSSLHFTHNPGCFNLFLLAFTQGSLHKCECRNIFVLPTVNILPHVPCSR